MKFPKITFNQAAAVAVILTCEYILVTHPAMPSDTKEPIKSLMLLAGSFLFGSTVGSHAKDVALANSTPIVTPPPPPAQETIPADPTQANI